MNKVTLLSILALTALLVAACGGAAAAPEATPTSSQSEVVTGDSDTNLSTDTASKDEADKEMSDDQDMSNDGDMADDDDTMTDHDGGTDDEMSDNDDLMTDHSSGEDDDMSEDQAVSSDNDSMADTNEGADDVMSDDDTAYNHGDTEEDMSGDQDKSKDDDAAHDDEDGDKSEDLDAVPTAEGDDSGSEPTKNLPTWFTAELTDVNSGETFTIDGLNDRVLLLETMAIWCSNCLRQQKEVKALHEALANREGWTTVVLDIDPNEKEGDLQAYTAKHGFDWTYAVAPREVAREIGLLYGDQFLNPPSTPMLVIDSQGEVHLLPFGRKDASDLQEFVESFLDAGS